MEWDTKAELDLDWASTIYHVSLSFHLSLVIVLFLKQSKFPLGDTGENRAVRQMNIDFHLQFSMDWSDNMRLL